jgi:hypothetical protein
MTETIQQLKEDIAILQEKLQKLEEMEKHKSPVEEAFKKVFNHYPTEKDFGEGVWFGFEKGYEAHQSLVDDANKIKAAAASVINCIIEGNPPNGCSSWSEWFELFGSKGILHNLNISAKEYQPPEPPKPKHLQQIIQECFDDKMNIHTIPDIIDRIEIEWTPLNLNQKENRGFTDGYSMGFDDALNLVRKTLR